METYALSIVGVLTLCLVSILSAVYSGYSKGRAGALSGPVIPADDGNLLYRIDRVHINSVEALAPFVMPTVLAMMVGVGPITLATLVWVYVAIRLIHLVIYLRGGNAAKGGSVRTVLYVSGASITVILIFVTGWTAIHRGVAVRAIWPRLPPPLTLFKRPPHICPSQHSASVDDGW